MSNIYELKCFAGRFQQILDGVCKADVRFDDRGYKSGDIIFLYEGYPDSSTKEEFAYTGRVLTAKITYVDKYAVQAGFVVLSLEINKEC